LTLRLEDFIARYSFLDERKAQRFIEFLNGDWKSCTKKMENFFSTFGKEGVMVGVLKKLCGSIEDGWLIPWIEKFNPNSKVPIPGDLHVHSNWSDGMDDIETIVRRAIGIGFKYIAITDHTLLNKGRVQMDVEKFFKRNEKIDEIQSRYKGIKILKGVEIDVNEDGSLDYPDDVLKECDFVIGAVHFDYGRGDEFRLHLMEMIAMNENVDGICHPLDGFKKVDDETMDRILDISERYSKPLELNLFPSRLSQNLLLVRSSRGRRVKFYFGTDSHSVKHLEFIFFSKMLDVEFLEIEPQLKRK